MADNSVADLQQTTLRSGTDKIEVQAVLWENGECTLELKLPDRSGWVCLPDPMPFQLHAFMHRAVPSQIRRDDMWRQWAIAQKTDR